ncbi:hypothetical protein OS21_27100 [Dickeya oryzae]
MSVVMTGCMTSALSAGAEEKRRNQSERVTEKVILEGAWYLSRQEKKITIPSVNDVYPNGSDRRKS